MKLPLHEFKRVVEHFGDQQKAFDWFHTTNFYLSQKTPMEVLKKGSVKKVIECIDHLIHP